MEDEFTANVAVVIGVDLYDAALGRLKTPVADAQAIARVLRERFGYEVILHCNSAASLDGLRQMLKELPERVGNGSRLLFYFAGHGVAQDSVGLEGPRGFLVPHGATASVETHLPMYELREALDALSCRHLLVILDCCFAGSFRWATYRPLSVAGEILYEERYRHWVRHPARWVLTSAAHDEYALDVPDHRRGKAGCHSPFATALLYGLAGAADLVSSGAGVITLAELYAYVKNRLTPHQSPLLAPLPGQVRGEYVFRDLTRPLSLRSAETSIHLDERANPYRGLESYSSEDSHLFFGRDDVIRRLLCHVRSCDLTVVVGPSGSGKSSLVQAGLLPRLRRRRARSPHIGWVVPPPLRAGVDPFASLQQTLTAAAGLPSPSTVSLHP